MSSLGSDTHGRTYDYDSPYFPQYRPEKFTQRHYAGRTWYQVVKIAPWTRHVDGRQVIVQGRHVSTWITTPEGFACVRHTSREINAPRHPMR